MYKIIQTVPNSIRRSLFFNSSPHRRSFSTYRLDKNNTIQKALYVDFKFSALCNFFCRLGVISAMKELSISGTGVPVFEGYT